MAKYGYGIHARPSSPGSRTAHRREYLRGILYSRRDMAAGGRGMIPFDRGSYWFAGASRAMFSKAVVYRGRGGVLGVPGELVPSQTSRTTYRQGRNVGSFKTRRGSWVKGKGGRFVGAK
jgi:hypothetical protein